MLISLNWLRDFVDLPSDLDPRAFGERFTTTCAEVEGIEPIEVGASGLIAAEVVAVEHVPDRADVKRVTLNTGAGQVQTVSAAPNLPVGGRVVYAPVGGRVRSLGEIKSSRVASMPSDGMILPGDALGIAPAEREAVFLPPDVAPGTRLDDAAFDDWVMAIDNHSITHRPDLWGHYGVAREAAAMYGLPLKPYPVAPLEELTPHRTLPGIPIEIDDAERCPRYSGLLVRGLTAKPAPLWMQLRLGHVGMRPINAIVDLTNYIMAELGQPMHAFDGDKVERIEVGVAPAGSKFTTLDGVSRALPGEALMIHCRRKPVALAGIMGGAETEISETTRTMLLESANFEPATIRRCGTALGLRTDAGARFEKSLDPANTVPAIQRFVLLARPMFPELQLASRLSDCYPRPAAPITIDVDPARVARYIGHPVTADAICDILTALDFRVERRGGRLAVGVPSFRATKDVTIEVDVIEEVARYIGFGNIAAELPEVTVRCFEPNALHQLEGRTLRLFCEAPGYCEIHSYLWDDDNWLRKLGYEPTESVELRNPSADNLRKLRQSIVPTMLAAVERNRFHHAELRLIDVGSVFPAGRGERRHVGLILAKRQRGGEDESLSAAKGHIDLWAMEALGEPARFSAVPGAGSPPWEHEYKTIGVEVRGVSVGRLGALPLGIKRRIDEHLASWAVVWAWIELDNLAGLPPVVERRTPLPAYPEVELDFSAVVDAARRYEEVRERLAAFSDPLLRRISFVGSFEGQAVGAGRRSLTFRACLGASDRTLVEDDLSAFRARFERRLAECGLELRR